MNIKDKVIKISKLLDELDEYDNSLPELQSNNDNKIIDLLHLIELNRLNTGQCYRVIKELRNLRIERRKIEDEMELLRVYKAEQCKLLNNNCRSFLLSSIGKTEKIQKSRQYSNRVYTEEEIKKMIGE